MSQFQSADEGNHISSTLGSYIRRKLLLRPWHLSAIVVLAVLYFATARLGLAFAIPPGNATAVWPPSGIALGTLLICGLRVSPGIWIGSFVVNYGTGLGVVPCLAVATGNTLEAIVALLLCRRLLNLSQPFRNIGFGLQMFVISAVACTIAATIGTGSLVYSGSIDSPLVLSNWSTWWLGDLAGVMLITPVFMCGRSALHGLKRADIGAVFSLATLAMVSMFMFGGWIPEGIAEGLLYLPLIVVFWLLLRFDPIVALLGNLLIAIIAVLGTSSGVGPFATEVVTQSLFELQLFMTIYALAGLTMAGTLIRQREAEKRESELSAKVEAAEFLRIKDAQLAHVSRLSTMGEMVAGIAHEVNQPLYAISNYAAANKQLLADRTAKNAELLSSLNVKITEQAIRAGEIIRGLRDFVGKTDADRTVFSVNAAVRDSIQLLNFEAIRLKILVEFETVDDQQLLIRADQVQFEQVLVNLLRNAFDSMMDSDAERRIVTIKAWQADNEVHVAVRDRGVGLTGDDHTKLFEPFYTTKGSGMGMGLAISRTLIDALDGRIWAVANSDVGSTFTVALPIHQEH